MAYTPLTHKLLDTILSSVKSTNAEIIIYGTGPLSRLTLTALTRRGAAVTCFCDGYNRPPSHLGYPVIDPVALREAHREATVFICLQTQFWTVYDELAAQGLDALYDVSVLTEGVEIEPFGSFSIPTIQSGRESHHGTVMQRFEDALVLPATGIIITERCTLKCRDCSNLIPYIQNKRDIPLDEVCADIEKLVRVSDKIVSLLPIGGETFLYKHLVPLISFVKRFHSIGRIVFTTNGTILPETEVLDAIAACPNATIVISNYGPLSHKRDEFIAALTARNVAFDMDPVLMKWVNMGECTRRNRSDDALRHTFVKCNSKNCITVLDGRFYRCGRAAFGVRAGYIPLTPADYVDLRGDKDLALLREELKRYLSTIPYLQACNYCDGTNIDSPKIEPAVQLIS